MLAGTMSHAGAERDVERRESIGTRIRRSAPLLALLSAAALLVFVDLGGPLLWEDEADTALFARSILEFGVPRAWDGRTFVDSDDGFRVAPKVFGQPLVMVGTPWLPYYAAAASFALFGESEWAARLPFALAALGTVALLYHLVLRETGSTRAAFAAALLLLASAQFQLYARESRSYALNMLFTTAILWGFGRLGARRRDPWLVVAAVLLFHVQVLPVALALGACAAVAVLSPAARPSLRPLLVRIPVIAACTLPWLAIAWSAVGTNWAPLQLGAQLPRRLLQLVAEASVSVPFLGLAVGLPLVWRHFSAGEHRVVRLCLAWLAICALLVPFVLSEDLLVVVGLRYVCGILPVAAALTGVLVARASGERRWLHALLVALFAATHLAGGALPWLALGETQRIAGVTVPVPRAPADKLLNEQWWDFARGLGRRDPGTLAPVVDLLRREAGPDDVVLTNFGWDGLYYYTDLRLGFRVSPNAPISRDPAIRTLPAYVFGLADADWVVWRGGAGPLLGLPLTRLRTELERRGAALELVTTLPETLWENRPELAWHRFPDVGYPFAPNRTAVRGTDYPDAQIFRVTWSRDGARP